MEKEIPFLGLRRCQDPLIWWNSDPLTCGDFLQQARSLAAKLPARSYSINMCDKHGKFVLGFAAALIRKQTCIFPMNRTSHHLHELQENYPDSYLLRDEDVAPDTASAIKTADRKTLKTVPDDILPIPSKHLAVVIFTSGTTERPKPNGKRWDSLVHVARITAKRFGFSDERSRSFVSTVPPYHMYGLEVTVMLPLWSGGTLYGTQAFYPEDIRKALAHVPPPRVLVTTPFHLSLLTQDGSTLPDLEMIISATAPLSQELCQNAEVLFHTCVHEIYGCTEAGSLASRKTLSGEDWRPLDGIRFSQRKGICYAQGPHLAEEVPLGDVIDVHPDGTFSLSGRMADMVNIAGKRASLSNLNLHLNALPGVRDGVFLELGSRCGDVTRLEAAVVAPELNRKDILQALRRRIDPAFLPRRIHFLSVLPRNRTGKIPIEEIAKLAEHSQ